MLIYGPYCLTFIRVPISPRVESHKSFLYRRVKPVVLPKLQPRLYFTIEVDRRNQRMVVVFVEWWKETEENPLQNVCFPTTNSITNWPGIELSRHRWNSWETRSSTILVLVTLYSYEMCGTRTDAALILRVIRLVCHGRTTGDWNEFRKRPPTKPSGLCPSTSAPRRSCCISPFLCSSFVVYFRSVRI